MLNWFRKARPSDVPRLTHPAHYDQTSREAPGEKQQLALVQAEADETGLLLVYRWAPDLPFEEADRLDSRARAYVACAIYDAARAVRLACRPAGLHGKRPAWQFSGERAPVSLIQADFDVDQKICSMYIGPVITALGAPGGGAYASALAEGFRKQFGEVAV